MVAQVVGHQHAGHFVGMQRALDGHLGALAGRAVVQADQLMGGARGGGGERHLVLAVGRERVVVAAQARRGRGAGGQEVEGDGADAAVRVADELAVLHGKRARERVEGLGGVALVDRGDQEALPGGAFLILDHAGHRPESGRLPVPGTGELTAQTRDAAAGKAGKGEMPAAA